MTAWSFRVVGSEMRAPTQEALGELQEILRAVSASVTPPRHLAVRYTACRAILLDSEVRAALPGFLTQCVSLQKFHDFIQLFSPNTAHRLAFVERSFEGCRPPPPAPPPPSVVGRRTYDVFGDS